MDTLDLLLRSRVLYHVIEWLVAGRLDKFSPLMIFGKVDDRIEIKFSENTLEEKILERKTIRLLAAHMV